ncbi:MAG: T9SS type A sorting domain-containing protein, partial [Chitinophagales bacterium]
EVAVAGCTCQWYKGASPIVGATSLTYNATTSGNYKCRVTKTASGCYKNSNVIAVSVPCRKGEVMENGVNIYPNPATTNITIEIDNNETNSVILFDALGQIIGNISTNENRMMFDVENLPAGIYVVKIKNGNSIITQNFVKQ